MNQDNSRLRQIQIRKMAYNSLLQKTDSIADCLVYQEKLDELSIEEKQILRRFDVVIA